jgi:hypothetical protein
MHDWRASKPQHSDTDRLADMGGSHATLQKEVPDATEESTKTVTIEAPSIALAFGGHK